MMAPVRILIADDHEVVRRGIRALLEAEPGWEVSAEAVDGREAVEKAKQLKPNVAILDISMPLLNGLEATRQIRKALPGTEVIILTMHESEQLAHDVLKSGARGYLFKSDAARDLVSAVRAASQHEPFLTSKVGHMVLGGYLDERPTQVQATRDKPELTTREREIVQLLAEGKSNKEIAALLDLSAKTVETHRHNLMTKLGLHSLSELVRYAVRNRIVEA
jgi:DNA-binding NarL/FixJ family response regulator